MGFFTLGFQEAKDMISESSDKLENYRWGGCSNFKSIINGTSKLILTDTKFEFTFLLDRQWLG